MTDMSPIVTALREAQAGSIAKLSDRHLGMLAHYAVYAFSAYDRDFPDHDYYTQVGALIRENVPICQHPDVTRDFGEDDGWFTVCDACGGRVPDVT